MRNSVSWLASVVWVTLFSSGCQSGGRVRAQQEVVLVPSVGQPVHVPIGTSYVGDELQQLAQSISATDGQRPKGWKGRADVTNAMVQIRQAARDEAIAAVRLELKIETQTSGGIDESRLEKVRDILKELQGLINSDAPPALNVKTEIACDTPHTLRYVSRDEYQKDGMLWSSYTYGDQLHIGRYIFQVDACNTADGDYVEPVLVLADPTKFVIRPRCKP